MMTVHEVAKLADDMKKCTTLEELDKFTQEKIVPIVSELGEFLEFVRMEYRANKYLIKQDLKIKK